MKPKLQICQHTLVFARQGLITCVAHHPEHNFVINTWQIGTGVISTLDDHGFRPIYTIH